MAKSQVFSNERIYSGKTSFDWRKITNDTTIKERIDNWLYPITQNQKYDFVLDVLQQNIEYVLFDRKEAFKSICQYFKIDILLFYKAIEEIQELLIQYKKVKVCKNGQIIVVEGENNV